MSTAHSSTEDLQSYLTSLDHQVKLDGLRVVDRMDERKRVSASKLRRQSIPGVSEPLPGQETIASLVRESGVLRWRFGVTPGLPPTRQTASRAALVPGEVIKQYAFEQLETSKVYDALTALDQKLTPRAAYAKTVDGVVSTGFREWRNGQFVDLPDRPDFAGKKVLLFIHGTFSASEALLTNGLQRIPEGAKFLYDVADGPERPYDQILSFDHPTLSVSPMLNAFDLAAWLRPLPKQVDMICHSRGGLVARWFCEAFAPSSLIRRVVFVGSPLGGTSLAAAPRLRSTLDLLTNIAETLRTTIGWLPVNPLFIAASGLLRVIGAVTGFLSKAPLFDAVLAMIPGLDGQSRTGNNEELRRLWMHTGSSDFTKTPIEYFAIKSNFEPQEIGWNFLRIFSKPMQRIADWGADTVFQSENDLVVDTASMDLTADARPIRIAKDFGTNPSVHHLNYFIQPETVKALRVSFGIS